MGDRRFSYIVTGKLRQLLRHWKLEHVISADAVDLLEGLLALEPTRLELQDVVQHRWLRR